MHPTLDQRKPAISEHCRRYGVLRFDVFGFTTGPDFDRERSEFDFLLDLEADQPGNCRSFVACPDAREASIV